MIGRLRKSNIAKYLKSFRLLLQADSECINILSDMNEKELASVKKKSLNLEQLKGMQQSVYSLQNQINPHFLYNTLECIRGQAMIDKNDEIANMIEALSSFFRYCISRTGNLVTLLDELHTIQNYMLIQKYRFGDRFSLQIQVDEEEEKVYQCLIPRLTIQPIIENSVFHGFEEHGEAGEILIDVVPTVKNLLIVVSDNGAGMSKERLDLLNEYLQVDTGEELRAKYNLGIGLRNINRRIQLLFGDEYGLVIYSMPGKGTDVEISLPLRYEWEVHEERTSEN